jgi:polyphenol oxidase
VIRPFGFDGDGVRAVVTTRHGGVSSGLYDSLNLGDHVGDDHDAVVHNRGLVARALGVERLTVPDQQHTSVVGVVTDAGDAFPRTDALVTDRPGVALAIMVADCTPVVLHDPVRRAVGAAHCGRNGTIGGVLTATVARMVEEFGTRPEDLRAGIGPGICRASYEVRDGEAAQMEAAFPGLGFTEPHGPGHHLLDIPAAVRHQLSVAGVRHVDDLGTDTLTHTDDFFSHRATTTAYGPGAMTGRFMAVIRL